MAAVHWRGCGSCSGDLPRKHQWLFRLRHGLRYQGTAGVTYPIDQNLGVVLAYKYQGANDANFTSPVGGATTAEYKSNNLSLGLVFNIH